MSWLKWLIAWARPTRPMSFASERKEVAGEVVVAWEDMDCYKKPGQAPMLCPQGAAEWRYSDNICRNHATHRFRPLSHPGHQRCLAHAAPLRTRRGAPAARQGTLPERRHLRRA